MCMHAQSLSHVGFCNPMGCSLPNSSVHGISQAEYWSGLPFSFPGALEPWDPTCVFCISCIADRFFTAEPSGRPGDILESIKKKNNKLN